MKIKVVNKIQKNMDLHIFVFYQEDSFKDKLAEIGIKNNYKKLLEDFKGKYNQSINFYDKHTRILLIGMGSKKNITGMRVRKCISTISDKLKSSNINNIMLHPLEDFINIQVEALSINNYSFNKYKTKKNNSL
jgi:leucyl aminopeptidase